MAGILADELKRDNPDYIFLDTLLERYEEKLKELQTARRERWNRECDVWNLNEEINLLQIRIKVAERREGVKE